MSISTGLSSSETHLTFWSAFCHIPTDKPQQTHLFYVTDSCFHIQKEYKQPREEPPIPTIFLLCSWCTTPTATERWRKMCPSHITFRPLITHFLRLPRSAQPTPCPSLFPTRRSACEEPPKLLMCAKEVPLRTSGMLPGRTEPRDAQTVQDFVGPLATGQRVAKAK